MDVLADRGKTGLKPVFANKRRESIEKMFISIAIVPLIALAVVNTSRAHGEETSSEIVSEVLYTDSTYAHGPLVVEGETLSFLKIRYRSGMEMGGRAGLIPRRRIRYLLYEDFATPYRDGVVLGRIELRRTKRYPKSGLLLFGLASLGAGTWLNLRSQDEGRTAHEITGAGMAVVRRQHERRRERFEFFSGLAYAAGFGFTITGLQWVTVWRLGNGISIFPSEGGRYRSGHD